jgi:hypothetical protein
MLRVFCGLLVAVLVQQQSSAQVYQIEVTEVPVGGDVQPLAQPAPGAGKEFLFLKDCIAPSWLVQLEQKVKG